ncbi:TonB-dependent receptor [Adhaeribacter aerolatus]|uniref:TonB-dependent receptor n=1 Tax=Adhaeribacter aerolatus TaxID=670289 RepID=A0A512B3F0_9BACT|nr:outer membrane beta-barrel family protein [Adhaeribacter aerolatus]GEO06488.1 TonB-dependent receptor [Adhaeribacter aerolatus]
MIKNTTLFFLLFLFVQTAWAQSASITGTVLDKGENQPIGFATVTLLEPGSNKILSGAIADEKGKFLLEKLAGGSYLLQVHFMGYETARLENIALTKDQQLNIGNILLGASARLLQEIQVTGQKATVYHQIDKQVYSAGQFQAATGGTGIDVLKNMPSVAVNAQGEISLRGSTGFTVYLNGKPVQSDAAQILSQIPANAIDNIEIITSPSAKYDPDGKAGIINITTKTGTNNGFGILANVQVGLPSVQDYNNAESPKRYGADATVNFRQNKWDISLGGSYLRSDLAGRRVGDVNTTIGNRFTSFPSVGERSTDKYNHSVRGVITYAINKNNSINAGIYNGTRTEYRLADIFYTNTTTNQTTGQIIGRSNYFNSNLVSRHGTFTIANLDFNHTFANKSTLTASGLFENDNLSGFTRNRNLKNAETADTLQYTETTTDRPLRGYRFKLDYAATVGLGKLEAGYQFRYHEDDGNFLYREKNLGSTHFTLYPENSGLVSLNNQIHSFYTQYSGKLAKLAYSGGLRYEYAARDLTIREEPTLELNLSNLFPSANALYTFNDNWKAKAGYSRRVQRTSNFALNPLPEREHSETLEQGDPNLLPEFIDLAEMGVIKNFKAGSVFFTFYHQSINNTINRVNRVYADTIISRIFTNAGRARQVGLETGLDIKPTAWWKLYFGGNVYNYSIKGSLFNNAVAVNNSSLVYSLNTNSTFSLSPTLNLQWSLNYLSERATAQGEDSRFFSPNLSLKKSFMNGKLNATLQWQNMDLGLLKSNEQRITTRGRDFYTTTNYIYEVDVFLVNLSFNLNQLSKKTKFTESEFGEKEF